MSRVLNFMIAAVVSLLLLNVGFDVPGYALESQSGSKPAPGASSLTNPVPTTPQSIAAGKALFQKYCRFCHGDDAKGNGPQAPEGSHPPDLTDAKWDHGGSDAEIFVTIKDGIGPKFDMKGQNSKMTPREMWSVVNYLRSIGPQGKSH